jgi:hypothetical protein
MATLNISIRITVMIIKREKLVFVFCKWEQKTEP